MHAALPEHGAQARVLGERGAREHGREELRALRLGAGVSYFTAHEYVREEFPTPPNYWEPLITYGFIAAATKTLRMGTGMLILPMRRDIVVVAKQISEPLRYAACVFPDMMNNNRFPCPGTPAVADILQAVGALAVYAVDSLLMHRPRLWNYRTVRLSDGQMDSSAVVPARPQCPMFAPVE